MVRDADARRDDQWERLRDLVPGGRAGQRGPRRDNRRFVDALLWMARSGGRWRDPPGRFGDHPAVKRRYCRAALDREGIAVRAGHHCAQPILRRFGLEAIRAASHSDPEKLSGAIR
jgi:transposase